MLLLLLLLRWLYLGETAASAILLFQAYIVMLLMVQSLKTGTRQQVLVWRHGTTDCCKSPMLAQYIHNRASYRPFSPTPNGHTATNKPLGQAAHEVSASPSNACSAHDYLAPVPVAVASSTFQAEDFAENATGAGAQCSGVMVRSATRDSCPMAYQSEARKWVTLSTVSHLQRSSVPSISAFSCTLVPDCLHLYEENVLVRISLFQKDRKCRNQIHDSIQQDLVSFQ